MAFHLIFGFTFDIKCLLYSSFDVMGMFSLFGYSKLNVSILLDANDKLFNNNDQGTFLYIDKYIDRYIDR